MSTIPTGTLYIRDNTVPVMNDRLRKINDDLSKVKDWKYVDINQQLLHCWGDSGLTS